MIQDKDFTLRLIRQLSQALEKLLLGKPEESLMQKELDFDSLMRDIFKMNFQEVSSKTSDELIQLVEERETKDHPDYYEMLGNLFYFHYKQESNADYAQKAKAMYQKYLQTSGIFALPIINRINSIQ
ncbi:hypothetical protein BAX97_00785 [Elizabethkingia meningoseptica]|uniref:hypothetical protein n=1 Tax=Elizabethkingia meningoseptica TaxID=238 RepID=UPI000332C16F|nr:hypothetical protein [Elizabethkingia meningoseptica]AQX04444.1 hypothetical protein BBD33_03925 [Elizabethkingia meningoseptica]AQX46486.1 hypothetical protein B5G46_03920 [Elizabethkingia meningoseptica]EOR31556.1 hypothetical protein L100_00930 [Elizabethkingia meningoseptica ATCC 13253 = NBRC 12535]KUY19001.1 hypothetical protein ATB99_04330 [Elizabethkingia meningoseptica]MDE5490256.1 hypothetical protein [Elizabethkingia meningoseptica]